jgi:hypothetical protein
MFLRAIVLSPTEARTHWREVAATCMTWGAASFLLLFIAYIAARHGSWIGRRAMYWVAVAAWLTQIVQGFTLTWVGVVAAVAMVAIGFLLERRYVDKLVNITILRFVNDGRSVRSPWPQFRMPPPNEPLTTEPNQY